MMSSPLRKTALALALASASLTCAAQVTVNDGLDGNWFAPDAGGRGVSIDAIARDDGSALLYGVVFTYDMAGKPLWLSFLGDLQAGQHTAADIPLYRFDGGRFDSATPESVGTVVGTASIDVSSCTSVSVALDMDATSGLPSTVLDVKPGQVNIGETANPLCTRAPIPSACPVGTTAEGVDCLLPSDITTDLHLPAGKTYLLKGAVNVRRGAALSIEPGVTVQGHADDSIPNFLVVRPGARLYAEGTPTRPIVFTGPRPEIGSWGGVVIAGNSTCNDYVSPAEPCKFEVYPDVTFGGDQLDDNSGILRYVRIQWAGIAVRPDEELNSLTLLGVGAGTTMEHVQVDGGKDDGIEFFGGNISGRYLVCSNMGDDCFDFDDGYHGKLQFLLAWQGDNTDIGNDSNGIESDNSKTAPDLLPRTRPQISNITLVGSGSFDNLNGLRIRRGSGGVYSNLVVTGFTGVSVAIDDAPTWALGADELSFTHSFVGHSGQGFFGGSAAGREAIGTWFNAFTGNQTGDAGLEGYLPKAESPVLTGGKALPDAFFRPVGYRGAFAGAHDDWTRGWTVNLPR